MATQEYFITGDQIASYSSFSVSGQSNGTKVTLGGTTPLGSSSDIFRIVVSNVNSADTGFMDQQTISVYAYPSGTLLYSNLDVDPGDFNGRATSSSHFIFDGPGSTGLVINLNGVTSPTMQIGPGLNPLRGQEFPFTNLSPTPPAFPCFVKGTLIETDIGPLPIETLRIGDRVGTMDSGLQPIRWIGKREVPAMGRLAPIRFETGAIGNFRPLLVSPQHRMLISSWSNSLNFGAAQVFVGAKHLVNGTTIRQVPRPRVTYVHLALDRHEVIFAEGIPTESLHLGAEALTSLDRAARDELRAIFPELDLTDAETARRCLLAYEAALLDPSILTGLRSPAA